MAFAGDKLKPKDTRVISECEWWIRVKSNSDLLTTGPSTSINYCMMVIKCPDNGWCNYGLISFPRYLDNNKTNKQKKSWCTLINRDLKKGQKGDNLCGVAKISWVTQSGSECVICDVKSEWQINEWLWSWAISSEWMNGAFGRKVLSHEWKISSSWG